MQLLRAEFFITSYSYFSKYTHRLLLYRTTFTIVLGYFKLVSSSWNVSDVSPTMVVVTVASSSVVVVAPT